MKIAIVGAGTSGLACAIELVNNGFKGENITMIDKGHMIDKRKCFVLERRGVRFCFYISPGAEPQSGDPRFG